MAWTTDLAAIHDPTTGNTPPAAWGDAINANAAAEGGAWTSFTPAWTNLTVGNAVQTGSYRKIGKTLEFRCETTLGTTSSVGSDPTLTLPGSSTAAASGRQLIQIRAYDTSAGASGYFGGAGQVGGGGTTTNAFNFAGSNSLASSTNPFTWATGDILIIRGQIEIA